MPEAPRDEPTRLYRWMVLIFISLAMFGNYYVYDCIAPVADLLAKQLGFSDSNIGLLQAIYSIPNVFMVLIGGYIVDRIGTRKAIFIFGTLCFAGSVVTVLSGRLPVMATGRLIFGLGAESLIVAVTTAVAKWFRGKELSFAFGINLMIARAGTWLAQNSPTWAHSSYDNWRTPLLISVGFGSLCVVFYSAIFPFETFAIKFFIEARGTSRELGGFLVSILTASTMFGTPLFGLFADRFGRRATLMMLGSVLLIPVYLILAYTNISPYVPMAMMGVAFSLVPALMWPSVAYIVDQPKLGTAYGLMTMIQNIGLAGLNLLVGWANDHGHAGAQNPAGYRLGMWIFSILSFLGVLFAFLLRQRELGPHGHGLETITTASGAA